VCADGATYFVQRLAEGIGLIAAAFYPRPVTVRFSDFKSLTRDLTLAGPTADAQAIRNAAGQCLKRAPLARRFRLLGVRVGGLQRLEEAQSSMPNQPPGRGSTELVAAPAEAEDSRTGQLF
jgi:DNA polymerase-4